MLGHPAGLGYLLVSVNWMVAPFSQRVGISSCKVAMVNPEISPGGTLAAKNGAHEGEGGSYTP